MNRNSFGRGLALLLLVCLALWPAAAGAAGEGPGALDLTFDPGAGANNAVFALSLQGDGKVLAGGQFTEFAGGAHGYLVRLSPSGAVDGTYAAAVTVPDYGGITSVALQGDGKALVGGLFTHVDGVARANLARLATDGKLDATFNPGAGVTGPDAYLNTVVLQADGKILIGGEFSGYNGTPRGNVARVTATGLLDITFDTGTGADNEVAALAVQPADGKVLIGGWFQAVDRKLHRGLARLNADGSVDATFNPEITGSVLTIALQPDGKILVGGAFIKVNGIWRSNIARLDASGQLDETFGAGADKEVDAIALQPDGKMIVGGKFLSVDGTARKRLARLSASGTLDLAFDPGAGASWTVFALTLQPDRRVLVGGAFEAIDGIGRKGVARLWGDRLTYLPLVLR